ncbi:MAG: lipoprotein-releasing system ATP-binding protein LolD, partial [Haliea sp.]|nr:lipoprotein-releasing system ATP-binding protein LolD [Haliea sp.]
MSEAVLRCEGLGRVYEDGDRSIRVLEGIDFELPPGDKVAVVGASG